MGKSVPIISPRNNHVRLCVAGFELTKLGDGDDLSLEDIKQLKETTQSPAMQSILKDWAGAATHGKCFK